MNLIIEAIFVGFYSSCFAIISNKINIYLYLFIIGFLKHFLSYYLKIQNFYCSMKENKKAINTYLIKDSFYEGICFIIIGNIIIKMLYLENNLYLALFLVGFTFHIIAEYIGIHKYFLRYRCL
jgi:hypothetical protein